MQSTSFSPREAISFGWNTFKEQKKFWIIAAILFSVLGSSGGGYNFGDSKTDKSETTQQVEQSQIPPLNQLMNEEFQYEEAAEKPLPLIPEQVDNVLGISDKRDNGNYIGFIILFVIAALIFALPYIIAVALIYGSIQMGFMKFFLTAARSKPTTYEIILSEVNLGKAYRYLATSFLYGLLVVVGLILFIIPGIYFALKYGFAFYFIVDRDAKIGEAFSLSAEATKGNKMNLLGLGILLMLINIAGFIALLYGLLVSIPVTMIASAFAYNKLSSKKGE